VYCFVSEKPLRLVYGTFYLAPQGHFLRAPSVILFTSLSKLTGILLNWRLMTHNDTGDKEMNVSRKIGIVVFCMVPAIIGGGIVYAIFHSYMPVFIYELLLLFGAGAFVSR